MKKTSLYLLFVFLFAQNVHSQVVADTIRIASNFGLQLDKPYPVNAGNVVITDLDLYLMKRPWYDQYQADVRTIKVIRQKMDNVFVKYDRMLEKNEKHYNILAEQCTSESEQAKKSLIKIRSDLDELAETMNQTESDIVNANEKLQAAQKKLAKARKQDFWNKVLYGAGGVGVGVILGILIN